MASDSFTNRQNSQTPGLRLGFAMSFLTLCVASLVTPGLVRGAEQNPARTNVVIFLADDLGWGDVGYHGGTALTTNIDRLASEGVRLNRFYAYPACSPARAAMLTGRFPMRFGISGPVRPRDSGMPVSERLLPADFQKAGYQTSLIGKWHLGLSTLGKSHPVDRGFDSFYGFMDASIDYFSHTNGRGETDWQRDGKTLKEQGYSTDLLADEAVRQIVSNDGRKPFCMVVAFNAPHSPFQAPESLVKKYSSRLGERDAVYAAMVESMDKGIGRVLKAIEDQGLRDNTIVVFASDNGAARMGTNAPFRGQKRQVYEGGIHVPCVIRAPGVLKPGAQSNQIMAIHDLFPTLAEAVGVKLEDAKPLDGISLWKNLKSGTVLPRSMVIAERDFAVIQDQWKLIQTAAGEQQVYDLRNDSDESDDLSRRQPQRASQLASQLAEYRQKVAKDLPANSIVAQAPTTEPKQGGDALASQKQEGGKLSQAALRGDVIYGVLGNKAVESNGSGLRLLTAKDLDKNEIQAAEASLPKMEIKPGQRWHRFEITGMAQDGFEVAKDDLYLKVEFFQKSGRDSLDLIKTRIYPQVVRERKDLKDEATNRNLGHGTWRTYAMDFRTPFAQIDQVRLSVGFSGGKATAKQSEFWVSRMNLLPTTAPPSYKPKANANSLPQPDPKTLVSLGGRWYFDPQGGSRKVPAQFDFRNAQQLLYKSAQLEAPFAGNMTSWLRVGYLDLQGDKVTKEQEKPDSLIVTFNKTHMVMRSRNLPNHATATFPDRWRMLDGNPSYIQEQSNTWHIPLYPERNPKAIAMDAKNSNQALPMGAIGVATNGVIFFNPFDHIFETDAVWRLDRCCGHPSPRNQYHYHKYPVCVKTPWSDEGKAHSSVIGFAFDGYPVYGPYERDGVLAKDDKKAPLNDFNLHIDELRGPHYHVTPGKYPHIIGGYWGKLETLNRPKRRQ